MLWLYTTRAPLPLPNNKRQGGAKSALRVILLYEQIPIRDARRVANQRCDRQLFWSARRGQQSQTGFVRQAIALAGVHFLVGPDEVFPRIRAATRSRQNVIERTFIRPQQ